MRAANAHSERQAVDEARLQDVERKAQSSEQNFQKMKSAYASLRQEHIEVVFPSVCSILTKKEV